MGFGTRSIDYEKELKQCYATIASQAARIQQLEAEIMELKKLLAGKGSVIYADGMLYCVGHRGRVALLAAHPAAYAEISMFQLPKGEDPCWTHPVISDGKLYLRWSDTLHVYDIKE